MGENREDNELRMVRETGVQYVVNSRGRKLGVLLSMSEYERYLELLKIAGEAPGSAASMAQVRDQPRDLVRASRLVPADALDRLTGLVNLGGNAVVDSETLYDPDWN
jgi:prevent-host-death family protein